MEERIWYLIYTKVKMTERTVILCISITDNL